MAPCSPGPFVLLLIEKHHLLLLGFEGIGRLPDFCLSYGVEPFPSHVSSLVVACQGVLTDSQSTHLQSASLEASEAAHSRLGSQHPSPNVKTFCKFEPQLWLEIITSRDAKSACFEGSRTSCGEIIFGIFWPNFGQKRSHHVMDASCR